MENLKKFISKEVKKQLLNESGFPRLKNILLGLVPNIKTIGIITAENPMGIEISKEENNKRNKKFEKEINIMNFGYIQIKGKYGTLENPFFISNIIKEELIKFGKEHEQKEVIYGEKYQTEKNTNNFKFYLIDIKTEKTVSERKIIISSGDEIKNRKDFYSEYKGRKFIIPFFDKDFGSIKDIVNKEIINGEIVEDINERINELFDKNRIEKSKWMNRGIVKIKLKKNNL